MAKHITTGKFGESIAQVYLENAGFQLLEFNWRYSRWEVDIIAQKTNILHFIEVKTRRSKKYGYPEDSVKNKKVEHLLKAAEEYLYQHPQWKRIQFDILSIIITEKDAMPQFLFIEDISL